MFQSLVVCTSGALQLVVGCLRGGRWLVDSRCLVDCCLRTFPLDAFWLFHFAGKGVISCSLEPLWEIRGYVCKLYEVFSSFVAHACEVTRIVPYYYEFCQNSTLNVVWNVIPSTLSLLPADIVPRSLVACWLVIYLHCCWWLCFLGFTHIVSFCLWGEFFSSSWKDDFRGCWLYLCCSCFVGLFRKWFVV